MQPLSSQQVVKPAPVPVPKVVPPAQPPATVNASLPKVPPAAGMLQPPKPPNPITPMSGSTALPKQVPASVPSTPVAVGGSNRTALLTPSASPQLVVTPTLEKAKLKEARRGSECRELFEWQGQDGVA